MPRGKISSSARIRTAALAVALLALTACSPIPAATPSASPSPGNTAPTAGPSEPALHPDGTAEENLPLFDKVTKSVWGSAKKAEGRAYVDALVAAGFDKKRMQVTQDESTVRNPAESLQFSVAWGQKQCLIGQVGPSTGEPVTMVMAQLAEGRCLIGDTRPIDW